MGLFRVLIATVVLGGCSDLPPVEPHPKPQGDPEPAPPPAAPEPEAAPVAPEVLTLGDGKGNYHLRVRDLGWGDVVHLTATGMRMDVAAADLPRERLTADVQWEDGGPFPEVLAAHAGMRVEKVKLEPDQALGPLWAMVPRERRIRGWSGNVTGVSSDEPIDIQLRDAPVVDVIQLWSDILERKPNVDAVRGRGHRFTLAVRAVGARTLLDILLGSIGLEARGDKNQLVFSVVAGVEVTAREEPPAVTPCPARPEEPASRFRRTRNRLDCLAPSKVRYAGFFWASFQPIQSSMHVFAPAKGERGEPFTVRSGEYVTFAHEDGGVQDYLVQVDGEGELTLQGYPTMASRHDRPTEEELSQQPRYRVQLSSVEPPVRMD